MVIRSGISVNAVRTTSGQAGMFLDVKVNDEQVRRQLDGFDGLERPFALIPYQTSEGGPVTWRRVDLGYETTEFQSQDHALLDDYEAPAIDLKDNVADKYGVVVGMDTNEGTVWAQDYGSSFRVHDAGQP